MSDLKTTPAGGTTRPIPEMVAQLRKLSSDLHSLVKGSVDAALFSDAANYIEGATGSLREHMGLLKASREETAAVRKISIGIEDLARKLGFYEGRDRAVAVCLRKAQASEDDDLTPIDEAIREQLIFASREIRELQPKGKGTEV